MPAPLDGLLATADMVHTYPLIGQVAFLMADYRLVWTDVAIPPDSREQRRAEIQRHQMTVFSRIHDRWYKGITEAQQTVLRERFYGRCRGCSVLDLGNGGLSAGVQMGEDIAASLESFMAMDTSYDMITRNGFFDTQVLGDARKIPLREGAVDYILVNGLLHHFGRSRGHDGGAALRAFFEQAMKICRRGIIAMELLIPAVAELAENILVNLIGLMPTYVYSEKTLLREIRLAGYEPQDVVCRRIGQLIPPYTVLPPILDFEWLRVPVAVVPYSFLFFAIDKDSGCRCG